MSMERLGGAILGMTVVNLILQTGILRFRKFPKVKFVLSVIVASLNAIISLMTLLAHVVWTRDQHYDIVLSVTTATVISSFFNEVMRSWRMVPLEDRNDESFETNYVYVETVYILLALISGLTFIGYQVKCGTSWNEFAGAVDKYGMLFPLLVAAVFKCLLKLLLKVNEITGLNLSYGFLIVLALTFMLVTGVFIFFGGGDNVPQHREYSFMVWYFFFGNSIDFSKREGPPYCPGNGNLVESIHV